MDEIDNGRASEFLNAQDEKDEQEAAVEQLARGATVTEADPARSTLHYGSTSEGEGAPQATEGSGNEGFSSQAADEEHENRDDAEQQADASDIASVAENAPGIAVASLSIVAPGTENEYSFDVSDDRFEVVGNELRLVKGVSLDFEAVAGADDAARIPVEITAIDGSGNAVTEEIVVNVEDLNENPEAVLLSSTGVDENAAGAVVGTLTVIDPDRADSHEFEVSDERFEVVDGQLRLREGVSLDHEAEGSIEIAVTVTDSEGASLTENFVVDVQDVNEGPEAVTLSANSVAENAEGATVGTLSAIDPDLADSHSFAVSDDRFEVVGNELKLKDGVSLDHEEAASLDVEVTATDSGGATITETFSVDVTDVNEGPEDIGLTASEVRENAAGATVGTLSAVDPDAGDSHTFEVSDSRFEVVGNELRLRDGVSLNHEEAEFIDVSVTATDNSGAAFSETFTITVADVNEGPEAMNLSTAQVAENAAGAVFGKIDVIDPDDGDTHSFEVSDNRFEVVDGDLRLREGVSLDHEDAASIDLEVTVTDADGATLTQSFTIDVADVNEGPTSLTLSSGAVAEGTDGAVIGTISVADPDMGDSHSYAVSDNRFEVVDGELRLRDDVALDHDEESSVEVAVTVTDSDGATLTETFSIDVVEVPDIAVSSGFHAKYFDIDERLRKMDDMDFSVEPTHEEITRDIEYANGRGSFWEDGATDTFAAQIMGNIEVTEGGTFDFHLGGDDGAILYINGEKLVDNDGDHGYRVRSGEIELEPGTHHIEVRYFENYGHAGLKLEWEGPGIDGRENVMAPDTGDIQTVSGVPVALEIMVDQEALPDGSAVLMEGLPEGTVLNAGENSIEVGADGSANVTGWPVDLLTVTPPTEHVGTIDASLVIEVPAGSGDMARATESFEIQVNEAHIEPPNVEMVGGFHASYFDMDKTLRKIDDIDWDADPTHEEMVPDINYENGHDSFWEGGSKDTFGAKLEGEVTVEEGGTYKFFAGGDDGVMLYIDGEPVINNDGLHGFRTRSGEVDLEPGTYDIEVRYFENYGRAGLKLEWEGPGTDGRELVRADAHTEVEENGTLQVGIDTGSAGESAVIELSGLPADTIIMSGEDSAVADGGPVDVSGWELDMIEISPPPGFEGVIEGEINVTDQAFNGAEVSTTSDFTILVGDYEAAQEAGGMSLEDMMAGADVEGGGAEMAWDAEGMDDQDIEQGDNVMEEPAAVVNAPDITDVNFETYERVDW